MVYGSNASEIMLANIACQIFDALLFWLINELKD